MKAVSSHRPGDSKKRFLRCVWRFSLWALLFRFGAAIGKDT